MRPGTTHRDGGRGDADLRACFQDVRDRFEDATLSFGEPGAGWTSIGALADPTDASVPRWLAEEAALASTADVKTQATLLLGRFASQVTKPLVALYLVQGSVPDLDPDALSVQVQRHPVPDGARAASAVRFVPCLPVRAPVIGPGDGPDASRDRLRALLTGVLGRMIERLRSESGLSRGALWRVAGDALGYLSLNLGRRIGRERFAMEEAMRLLKAPGARTNNSRLGYVEITVPADAADGAPACSQWFLARGGCCRYYACEGGEVCVVCVLRSPAERDGMLRDLLAKRRAAAT